MSLKTCNKKHCYKINKHVDAITFIVNVSSQWQQTNNNKGALNKMPRDNKDK